MGDTDSWFDTAAAPRGGGTQAPCAWTRTGHDWAQGGRVLEMRATCWAEAEVMSVRRARNECSESKSMVKHVDWTCKKRTMVLKSISSRSALDGVPSGCNE